MSYKLKNQSVVSACITLISDDRFRTTMMAYLDAGHLKTVLKRKVKDVTFRIHLEGGLFFYSHKSQIKVMT